MYGLVGTLTMTTSNLVPTFTHSTGPNDHKFDKNTYPHHPMNKGTKAQTKMTPVNEETKDKVMTEAAMLATSTSAMQTSAWLAKKLKKLMAMDMSASTADAMEINKEEQRKQSRAGCPVIDIMIHTPKSPMVVDLPENPEMMRHQHGMPSPKHFLQ